MSKIIRIRKNNCDTSVREIRITSGELEHERGQVKSTKLPVVSVQQANTTTSVNASTVCRDLFTLEKELAPTKDGKLMAEVSGRRRQSPLLQGGLEIPCTFMVKRPSRLVQRV